MLLMSVALYTTDSTTIAHQPSGDRVSYEVDIAPIMQNYCTTCHGGNTPVRGILLTNYKDVRTYAESGNLLHRVNDRSNPMPPSGLLPSKLRKKIQKWAQGGFLKTHDATGDQQDDYLAEEWNPSAVSPIDVTKEGFDLLEHMQGHWIGSMKIIRDEYDWFSFDYRAISPSHVHGIFEGGSMGNLFTSFFVANFKGTQTIMARNGGILNGIYRTSYFVLDSVSYENNERYYRLVDAEGGKRVMWMELTFSDSKLSFNSYTSRLGTFPEATRHMTFKATKKHTDLAAAAAKVVGFPKNIPDWDFSTGLPDPYIEEGDTISRTATYLWQDVNQEIETLARLAKDPYRIDQIPHLSKVTVQVKRTLEIKDKKLFIYLSRVAMTDEQGYFKTGNITDEILSFPEIVGTQNEFTFTYLHPGTYYLTVIADANENGYVSPGDITHASKKVIVLPTSEQKIVVKGVNVQN